MLVVVTSKMPGRRERIILFTTALQCQLLPYLITYRKVIAQCISYIKLCKQ